MGRVRRKRVARPAGKRRKFLVTPWKVVGKVDYKRLIKEFGVQEISSELGSRLERAAGESHLMIRRGIFFSHRDLELVLDDHKKGKGFFLYTGRGPSGPMHIGHILPFYFTSWLQKRFSANVYVPITDDEKFLEEDRKLSLEEALKWSNENILDIIAAGFDPDKTFIFQDTEYVGRVYSMLLKVARRINFSWTRAIFGFTPRTNIGMIFYPAIQVLPTLFERKRCLIPSAIDQDPYWRIQRDLAEGMGYHKAAAMHSKFLPSLTGPEGKMSSSAPQTSIFLHDDDETIRDKIVHHAFSGGQPTAALHRKLGGNPDIDVPYQWLYMFFEDDDVRISRIREDYRSGKLLSGEIKEILAEKILKFMEEHRRRREEARETVRLFKYDGELARKMWEIEGSPSHG